MISQLKTSYLFSLLFFINNINANSINDIEHQGLINTEYLTTYKSIEHETKLLPSPSGVSSRNGQFGTSVSFDGNRAIIGGTGIYEDSNGIHEIGEAWIFEFDGSSWQEVVALTQNNNIKGNKFGESVSISGNRVLIGAPLDDENGVNSGAVYLYEFNGDSWEKIKKFTADDGKAYGRFGNSVVISGNRAIIGSYTDSVDGVVASGSIYIFEFDGVNWIQVSKLSADDKETSDQFGSSLSHSGNRILVGTVNSNSVYIFDYLKNQWSQSAILTNENNSLEEFGSSVSISGNRAIVGAHYSEENGYKSGSAYVFDYDGKNWVQSTKLLADDGERDDEFGYSVHLNGNRALVGAYHANTDQNTKSGSAYVFEFNGVNWDQTSKITANDGSSFDNFGNSVYFQGDKALIGSYHSGDSNHYIGSAYFFEFDNMIWNQTEKIKAKESAFKDYFGNVSLSENRALVGASYDDNPKFNSGSAYIFDYINDDWVNSAKLAPVDATIEELFGSTNSLSGNRALIGAFGNSDLGEYSGSVYVFDYDGINWHQSAKLTASDGGEYDFFGNSISHHGDRAIIGAYNAKNKFGINAGAVYVFEFDGIKWNQTAKLNAGPGAVNDFFGASVSLENNRILIGAYGTDDDGSGSGSAYIFEYIENNWLLSTKLTANQAEEHDRFGNTVSLFGDRALIGASGDNDNGPYSGAAYIFEFEDNNWSQTAKLTASDGEDYVSFSRSLSLWGNRAAISAETNDHGNDSGSFYVFDYDGENWNQSIKITAIDANEEDFFGSSISLIGDRVLTGAPYDDDYGLNSGSAYIYNVEVIFKNGME